MPSPGEHACACLLGVASVPLARETAPWSLVDSNGNRFLLSGEPAGGPAQRAPLLRAALTRVCQLACSPGWVWVPAAGPGGTLHVSTSLSWWPPRGSGP